MEGFEGVLLVIVVNSRANSRPRAVIVSAAILMWVGIVIGWVFSGVVFSEIISPATMLPAARRVIGLMIFGLFSFSSVEGQYRGSPVCTNVVIRRL